MGGPLKLDPDDIDTIVPRHVGTTVVEATNEDGETFDVVRVTVYGHLASDPEDDRVFAFVLPPAQVGAVTTEMHKKAADAAGF